MFITLELGDFPLIRVIFSPPNLGDFLTHFCDDASRCVIINMAEKLHFYLFPT